MALTDVLKNLSKQKKIVCACVAAAVVAAVVIGIVVSRSNYLATTMRLLRIEGTVNIEDSKGAVKPVMDNLRFQSGDALNTGEDGLASVGLDEHKIITLQNDSRAEFKKKSKHLELKLTKGAIFFNVAQKLRADETFEIKTSTMTAGIRGTSGMVYYDDADGRETLLITDGSVEVSATNPETGETKTAMVESGQEIKVYLFFDRTKDSVAFELNKVTDKTLPKFAAKRIAENDALTKRVCAANNWDKDNVQKKSAEPESTTTAAPKNEPTTTTTTEATTTTNTEATTTTTTTTETTESATVTESTTAKPTSTPTPKPKATSTPKPTPTKKPTPKVTETSAESTPETATETTSSEPTPPSGYRKWNNGWGKNDGSRKIYICESNNSGQGTSSYLGYESGSWIELTRLDLNSMSASRIVFQRKDGSQYYQSVTSSNTPSTTTTTTKETTKPTSSDGPTPPSGYSKWLVWGESTGDSGKYICSGSGYLGYDDGKWVKLTRTNQSTQITTIYKFTREDGSTYYTYTKMKVTPTTTTTTTTTKATTTTTTTKATSSVPSLPNGYSKVSQGWGVTYNGATVYVCQLTDHSVSGSEYLGYEGGKWINLSYSEQKSGRYMDHLYKKSDNSVYFSYDTKLY